MIVSHFLKEILHFIFPSRCLYCEGWIEKITDPLCLECVSLLQLVSVDRALIISCCFEELSPAKKLLDRYEESGFSCLNNLLASFMIVQWSRLGWEMPDTITSLPIPAVFASKNDVNRALAKSVAKMLQRPYKDLFGYRFKEEVFDSDGHLLIEIFLKKKEKIGEIKNLLIIHAQEESIEKYRYLDELKSLRVYHLAFLQNQPRF